jgi:ATP-dependent DNA ligase
MVPLGKVSEIPLENTVMTAKYDGEFTILYHDPERTYTVNNWGTMRTDYPALDEAREALNDWGLEDAVLRCELYAFSDDGVAPPKLYELLSVGKGKNAQPDRLRLMAWDIVYMNGEKVRERYATTLDRLERIFEECDFCHAPYWTIPTIPEYRDEFWETFVEGRGFEGVVAKSGSMWYKVKPLFDVDAVIIALNKTEQWRHKKVTSLKTGLLLDDGRIVELSDVSSGISHDLWTYMWKLREHCVKDDDKEMWIRPFIVVTLQYNETIKAEKQTWRYADGTYIEDEKIDFVSLRHPRFTVFRPDKRFDQHDLRVSQIRGF